MFLSDAVIFAVDKHLFFGLKGGRELNETPQSFEMGNSEFIGEDLVIYSLAIPIIQQSTSESRGVAPFGGGGGDILPSLSLSHISQPPKAIQCFLKCRFPPLFFPPGKSLFGFKGLGG